MTKYKSKNKPVLIRMISEKIGISQLRPTQIIQVPDNINISALNSFKKNVNIV